MRKLSICKMLIAIPTAMTIGLSECNAAPDPEFLINEGTMWVAGRDSSDTTNRYVAIVIKIEDDPDEGNPAFLRAKMWGYTRKTGPKYSGRESITPGADDYLKGELENVKGMGPHRRQRVTLKTADEQFVVLITALVQRSKKSESEPSKIVICRYSDMRRSGCEGKEPKNCDEPPTEDILEEEENIDPDMEMDPSYVP